MIPVEDWAEIRRLHRAEQMPIMAIAWHLGISMAPTMPTVIAERIVWEPLRQLSRALQLTRAGINDSEHPPLRIKAAVTP